MADSTRIQITEKQQKLVERGQKCLDTLDGHAADVVAGQAELICIANAAAKEFGLSNYLRLEAVNELARSMPAELHDTAARLLLDMTGFDFSGGDKGQP